MLSPPEKIAARPSLLLKKSLKKILFLFFCLPTALLLTVCGGGSLPTTTVSGRVVSTFTDRGARVSLNTNNVAITLEMEGIALPEVKTRTIGATVGAYSINDVAHNGTLTIKASYSGFKHYSRTFRSTAKAVSHNINLVQ